MPNQDAEEHFGPDWPRAKGLLKLIYHIEHFGAKDLHQQFLFIFTNYKIKVGDQGAELEKDPTHLGREYVHFGLKDA